MSSGASQVAESLDLERARGIFEDSVDFGLGPLVSAGQSDLFVAKFAP